MTHSHLPLPLIVVWACFSLFSLFWLVMAFRNKRTLERQRRAEMRRYLWPLLIGMILMSLQPQPEGLLAIFVHRLLPLSPGLRWTGAAAGIAGLFIAIWARLSLGRNWSGDIQLKEDHELVTRGPYAAIRHPIYTALILLFIGLFCQIATSTAVLGLALIVLSCWIKLRAEEALMTRTFPDAYPAYMRRTRRLVPWLV